MSLADPTFRVSDAAPAGSPAPGLVVSVHDVCPATWPVAAAMLADLRRWGVARCSLLVVPDYHGQGYFTGDAAFCAALREAAAAGHELVLHGYTHARGRRPRETWRTRWVTRVYTADEGEFFDLPRAEAADRLRRARADLAGLLPAAGAAAGGGIVGFIAPAWLLGPAAEEAVRAEGFRYTTRVGTVVDYRAGRVVRSRSLVYSCRNAWRRTVSLAWNAVLWAALRRRGVPLVRLGLHPPDHRHPRIWRQAERIVRAALDDSRRAVTYQEWLDGCPAG